MPESAPQNQLPQDHQTKDLPIDSILPLIVEALSKTGQAVLQAQPGAGKTTRVAPALLDAGLAELSDTSAGLIVILQPRRVAARAAATYMAACRNSKLGDEIGYQVRFEKRCSKNTRILVLTEGVFLRMLQDDPLLENIAIVIFDEFHERSIDSDLALAMVKQVRSELRPDLKLLVMSATLNTEAIAAYLGSCPVFSSAGRSYPVEIEYLPAPTMDAIENQVSFAVRKMLPLTDGHLLVFLPGLYEIRKAHTSIELALEAENMNLSILPLYGDMSLEEQQAVLDPSYQKRKIILATNLAETSLTIEGVAAVIDSGLARINRLDPRLGLNRLELSRISKASAEQRAGRAGRRSAGRCLRLWSRKEHEMLQDYESSEISRVELSQCILQLFAWGERKPDTFPWFEKPPAQALEQANHLLLKLGALENGGLTELGKKMAALPLQPRLARLLIAGSAYGYAKSSSICAALLSERDPFKRKEKDYKVSHHSDSDLLDRVAALETYEESSYLDSPAGTLMAGAAKNILRISNQLARQLKERLPELELQELEFKKEGKKNYKEEYREQNKNEALLKAIFAAFNDRLCKRRDKKGRRALMAGGRGVRLADESALMDCEFFVAVELLDSGKSESLVRQASLAEKNWLAEANLKTTIETAFDLERKKVIAVKRVRYFDLIIEEQVQAIPEGVDCSQILASAVQEHFDINELIDEASRDYLARICFLQKHMPELNLPAFGSKTWTELLAAWTSGATSIEELQNRSLIYAIQSKLSPEQISAIESEAPDKIIVASGSRIKVQYQTDEPPLMAVRIQELFGTKASPRIAASRVAVLMHLLAPNYRVQQITPDLESFWQNTYPEVKKELKRRYPKHSWPDDPLSAQAESRPQRKKPG